MTTQKHESPAETLRGSESRYRTMFEDAPVSIWEEDWRDLFAIVERLRASGVADFRLYFNEHPEVVTEALSAVKILDVNMETVRMFGGKDKEDLLASLETVFATPDTLPGFVDELVALAEGKRVYETEMRLCTVHMDIVHVLLKMIFPPSNSASKIVFVCLMDITDRKGMEVQLRQSQKMESIGTLAGGVAHEINNPINGIMNYAQLILDKLGPDSPVAEYATEIGHETERVAAIVKALLSFARQEKQDHSPARMCDIVQGTLSLTHTILRHDQIQVDIDISEDLPQLKCRSQQIQQVIMNLITNARYALNEKYPGADANKRMSITAHVFERDGEVWIRTTVDDHGPGIPEAIRARLFDPFYTTKPRDEGTGLGLSISHGIVTDHHGELSVESEPGAWTRFHIDLPVNNGWEASHE